MAPETPRDRLVVTGQISFKPGFYLYVGLERSYYKAVYKHTYMTLDQRPCLVFLLCDLQAVKTCPTGSILSRKFRSFTACVVTAELSPLLHKVYVITHALIPILTALVKSVTIQ